MFLFYVFIWFITSFSFSPCWQHSVHLYYRAWQSEYGGCLDFILQGTGTCFVTFAVAFSILNIFYVLICSSTLWLNVISYCLHMFFLWLNFSVLLAKVWSQYLQQQSSSMWSCIRVRDAHNSLHFLKLNFAAPNKVIFFYVI